jgi:putative flippase GtrA
MLFSHKQNSASPSNAGSPLFWLRGSSTSVRVEKPTWLNIPVWFRQIVQFGLVGVLNTLIDVAFYFLLSRSGLIPSLILAKGVSYAAGVLNSFYWNKSWTFQSHVESHRVFLPFVAANVFAVGLNLGVMNLALNTLGLPEPSALALATLTTFVWNFVISKFFIFK